MSDPSTSVVPSDPLTIPTTNPPAGTQPPPSRFVLFSEEWLHLQTFITQALALPIDVGDWDDKYGSFSDESAVTTVLTAMGDVQSLSATFGDPTTLRQEIASNPSYLTTTAPPDPIYGHIVWLANQIENVAGTFSFTFSSLSDVLSPSAGTPQQRADNLKAILIGPGGLQSSAQDMQSKTAALQTKLGTFDTAITTASTAFATYTSQDSKIVDDANTIIKNDNDLINQLQGKADEALKEWRDYTIAAVTTSVGLMILTGGLAWPAAVGLGVGLGVKAAEERALYNAYMTQIGDTEADRAKKNRLVNDLQGLNQSMTYIAPAMSTFKSDLETIEGVWSDIGMNLGYIVNNYGVDQLSDLGWVMQALKIEDAQSKWRDISTTAQQFTQDSLVSYDSTVTWGQQIPASLVAA